MNYNNEEITFLCSGPYSKEETEYYFRKFNTTLQQLDELEKTKYYFFLFENMESKFIDIKLIPENILFDELIKIPYNFKCINLSKENFDSILKKGFNG